jgi:hypothetical protein
MVMYRVFRDGVSFGDISGEAVELKDAIEMAEEYSRKKQGAKFVVEKVERVWPPAPARKPGDNAIHATIHPNDTTGRDDID